MAEQMKTGNPAVEMKAVPAQEAIPRYDDARLSDVPASPDGDTPTPPYADAPKIGYEHEIAKVRPCVAGDRDFNPEEPKYLVTYKSGLVIAVPHG